MNNNAKYARGKIYTIRSHKTNLIYVGSTVEPYLSTRLKGHRNDFKRYKNGKKRYCTSYDIFKEDENCYIELYEYYPCNTDLELRKREGDVIRLLDCCNKCIPGRTDKQWREDNRERIKEKNKQWRDDNKDKIKIYRDINKEKNKENSRQYRVNNKEKIKQKFQCECGSNIRRSDKARHLKTKKHREYMEFMYN